MLKGSCLCAGITYEIDGPLTDARNCHCSIAARRTALLFDPAGDARDFREAAGICYVV
jgi:hypothetical protein